MGETSLKIYKGAAVSIRKSVLAYLYSQSKMDAGAHNEYRRKEGKV